MIGLNAYDENTIIISPHLIAARSEVMFVAEIVVIATRIRHPRIEGLIYSFTDDRQNTNQCNG